MERKDFVPVNEFTARGTVTSISQSKYGNRVLGLFVRERREDLNLIINLEGNVGRGINPYDHITVNGYVKAFRYHNDALDKDSDVLLLVATSVSRTKPELATRFGEDIGKFYPEPFFKGFISGRVEKRYTPDDSVVGYLRLTTCGGGHDQRYSHPELRYYLNGRLPAFDYNIGDHVACRFSMRTQERTTKSGTKLQYQNMRVEDIAYLFKKERPEKKESKKDFQEEILVDDVLSEVLIPEVSLNEDEPV